MPQPDSRIIPHVVSRLAIPQRTWHPLRLAPFAVVPKVYRDELLNHSAVAELAEIPNESVSVEFDEGVLIFIVNVEGQTAPKIFQAHPLLHLSDYWEDGDNRFGPMRYNELRREYADRLWSLLTARLQAEILLGRRTIVARLATPLAEEFTAIPSDVWEHFSVTDWWRGVATSAAGERLYSIHLIPGAADPSSPADTSLWLAQMRSEKVAPAKTAW